MVLLHCKMLIQLWLDCPEHCGYLFQFQYSLDPQIFLLFLDSTSQPSHLHCCHPENKIAFRSSTEHMWPTEAIYVTSDSSLQPMPPLIRRIVEKGTRPVGAFHGFHLGNWVTSFCVFIFPLTLWKFILCIQK